jgi:NAD(P)-dependent dehydrogenase (short-subunit alcohol dehydrogenase family)
MTVPTAFNPLAPYDLTGRTAIITGASSGLGSRFAAVLHGLGATVVVSARRKDRLDQLVADLGSRAIAVEADVSEAEANDALVAAAIEQTGRLDVVIANAGITNVKPALKETSDEFARVLQVDLVSPFALARAAANHWRTAKQGGSVVMVASVAGHLSDGILPQAGYVAAKTGLVGLTRELALQWGRYGIRVNALCPGMFPSEMTVDLTGNPDALKTFEAMIPLRRVGATHELDGAVAFLASDASSYMTGQSLIVDGGVHT